LFYGTGGEGDPREYPDWANNGARRALVDFLRPDLNLAIEIDTAVQMSKPDSWVGNSMKERVVRRALLKIVPDDFAEMDELFELVKAREEYR
jgi:type I restriction enzyme R subunit